MYDVYVPKSIIGVIVLLIILVLVFVFSYKKAPPDTAYIISGLKQRSVIGKATFKLPLIERLDSLSLKLIPINVKTAAAVPTADYININVDAIVTIKIGDSDDLLKKAAQNFLNKKIDYISGIAQEVLEGNMREIVGNMKLEDMVSDRATFSKMVTESAQPDLNGMGLIIVSFNVQNFTDNNGVIEDLGIDNTEAIKKKAAIARAEAKRDIDIASAKADKDANEERVKADTDIAEKKNALEIRKADLKIEADKKNAEADVAYEIMKETQRRTVEVRKQEADIAKQEMEVQLKEKEAEAKEKELDATVRKQAEANKYSTEKEAEAVLFSKQRDAEAALFEVQKKAEADKAQADAALYIATKNAAAKLEEAKGIEAVGRAEAVAIEEKGKAEAVAMERKAEAYQKYNSAAVAEMLIKVLPDVAGAIAKPMEQIDKITIIGSDGAGGADSVASAVPGVMTKLFESMRETVGIDLGEVVKAGTYDAKVTKNVNFTGLPEQVVVNGAAETAPEVTEEPAEV